MTRFTRGAISVLGLYALFAAGVSAQVPMAITGVVTTKADGLPVPGATVSLVGADVSTTTDTAGKYRLEGPPAFARARKGQIKVEGPALPPKMGGVQLPPGGPVPTPDVGISIR